MEVSDQSSIGSVLASGVRVGPAGGRAIQMPRAQLVTRKVSSDQTGGAYSLFEVTVGPGGGEGPHVQHREDECFYVLEGRFALAIESVETEFGPGEHLYVPKGVLHAYENVGDATGRLLAIYTPGGAREGLVEAIGGPVTGGALASEEAAEGPAEKLAAIGAAYGVEVVTAFPPADAGAHEPGKKNKEPTRNPRKGGRG